MNIYLMYIQLSDEINHIQIKFSKKSLFCAPRPLKGQETLEFQKKKRRKRERQKMTKERHRCIKQRQEKTKARKERH